MDNKQIAQEIRLIAKSMEETGTYPIRQDTVTKYTCIILSVFNTNNPSISIDLRKEYEDIFSPFDVIYGGIWLNVGLRNSYEIDVWRNMPDTEREQAIQNQRITMLCFLAAMVETGDI